MAQKKKLTAAELVDSHKPKYMKYKYIFKDDDFLEELLKSDFDMDSTDTINNDTLTQEALKSPFTEYPREIIGKANEPTIMDNGVIVSKKMVTKADKKLLSVGIGFFHFNNIHYMAFKLSYEKFDILELFILLS